MNRDVLDILASIQSNTIDNYIAPGLRSHLIGQGGVGCVRMFDMARRQGFHIAPHSHRFDFACLVLRGSVGNIVYEPATPDDGGDEYQVAKYTVDGFKERGLLPQLRDYFIGGATQYLEGEWYSMAYSQFHSIEFSRDALVLFFEGQTVRDYSEALRPIVNGKVLDTFHVEDWMYKP